MLNLSTGPVGITHRVMQALASTPISHRCSLFHDAYHTVRSRLCQEYNTKECIIMTGSGTLANEAMLHQIKALVGTGLILSNGEFGNRLIHQASRLSLMFDTYSLEWGKEFCLSELKNLISLGNYKWLLFCHCETSTGVLNDMEQIVEICSRSGCLVFADCMSSLGTGKMDVSRLAMCTASSGKGLASVPGLAIVLSNIDFVSDDIPVYLDLLKYTVASVPFTLSSNLLFALRESIEEKLCDKQYALSETYHQKFCQVLRNSGVDVVSPGSHVLTFSSERFPPPFFESLGIKCSHESEYLQQRGWIQLAFFGCYDESVLKSALERLRQALVCH